MSVEITINGAVCGNIWIPNARCGRYVNASISNQRDRFNEPGATLRECALAILLEESRDFQSANFTADTVICATSTTYANGRRIIRERQWEIGAFPSISDLIDAEAYSCDFGSDDDGEE